MQKLMISAVLALLTIPALAQDHHRDRGGQGPAPAAAPAAPAAAPQAAPRNFGPGKGGFGRASAAAAAGQAPAAPQAQARPQGGNNSNWRGNNNNGNNHSGWNGNNNNRPGFNPGNNTRPSPGFNGGNNRPGNARNYSNFRNYHQNYSASRRFHAGAYSRPSGWSYRRWSFGQILPSLYWAQQYWLNDYAGYDLPPPPYGAVWVRYGNDALLVDRDTGEIITVEYDVFY